MPLEWEALKFKENLGFYISRICTGFSLFLGILGIGSRIADIPWLRGMGIAALEMKPNTALGLILASLSLLCLLQPEESWRRLLGRSAAVVILFLGSATLLEIILGIDLQIDELLMEDLSARKAGLRPGLMVPATALNFIFCGLALLTLDWRTKQRKFPSQWFSILIFLAPIQVLIAYSHGAEALLRSGPYPQLTQMALHTAVAWISLSTGLLCARPKNGFMATLFADTYSAASFRRILPIAIATPIALAWISVLAEKWNLYHPGFGTSFLALLITLILAVFVWRTYFDLGEYEQKLARALDARDEFLSIASHDLKTPLAALALQLQMHELNLKNGFDPVEFNKGIQLSLRQVKSLTGLVNDLLDVSTIQTGNLPLDQSEMDLSKLVREVAARLSQQLKAAQCNLELQLDDGLVGTWDGPRLEQVIVNLVSNAIKYAPQSALKISTEREDSHAILIVSDMGPGIAKEKQAAIFERFERANLDRNVSGMGLGLFIVKKIVEAHKGTVLLESEVGRGTEFIVRLPMRS